MAKKIDNIDKLQKDLTILRLRKHGYSYREIANFMNYKSRNAVVKIIKKAN